MNCCSINGKPPASKKLFLGEIHYKKVKNNKFYYLKYVFTSNPDKIEATIFLLFPTSNHSGTPKRTLSRHPAIFQFSFEIWNTIKNISRPCFSINQYNFFAYITLHKEIEKTTFLWYTKEIEFKSNLQLFSQVQVTPESPLI